ncbi:MAG: Ig-like domain-containing protein [Thermomicrobiales bacterium]
MASTSPVDEATDVAVGSDITATFSEPVSLGTWYAISCTVSGSHTAGVTGGPTVYTIDPDTNFVLSEECT